MKTIGWMALGVLGQLVLGYTIVNSDSSIGKEYYMRVSLCALVVAVAELGSHFDISRSGSLADARGAVLYRLVVLNIVGLSACVIIALSSIVQCQILDTIITFLSISLRPHGIAISAKKEELFWRNESMISWLGVSVVYLSANTRYGVIVFLLLKSVLYVYFSRAIFNSTIIDRQWFYQIKNYIKMRGIGGSIERSYFNLSWPFFPIVLIRTEIPFFENVWPSIERACAGLVSVLPVYLNNSSKNHWRSILIIRRSIGFLILLVVILTRSKTLTWVASVLYIALTDALLISAIISKSCVNIRIFKLSSLALVVMYTAIFWNSSSLYFSMIFYCILNELFLVATQPFKELAENQQVS